MAETTTPVNLLFKYGDFSKLSSTIDQGTIYFAKDDTANHENNKGYIYYGDPTSGTKNSIIGDGYFLKNNNQFFINRSILNIGTNDIYLQQDGTSLIVNGLEIIKNASNIELSNNIFINGQLSLSGHVLPSITNTYNLGSTNLLWNNIYLKSNSYIYNSGFGYHIVGNSFKKDNDENTYYHGIALTIGKGGTNRGLHDYGNAGLSDWLLYWNLNSNSIMRVNKEFNIDTATSDNLKISFNTKYLKTLDSNYYSHSGAYLKIYGIPKYGSADDSIIEGTFGSDLILSSGNALLLASGDEAQNFYDKYLKPPENSQTSNYSRTENFFLLSDNNFFFHSTESNRAIAPLVSKELDLGTSSLRWNNIYGELVGNSSTSTKLANSVNINGTAFDGSSDITTDNWGAERKITIHGDAKNFNGNSDIEFTIRDATDSQSGVVSIGEQTFAGNKIFNNGIYFIIPNPGIKGLSNPKAKLEGHTSNVNSIKRPGLLLNIQWTSDLDTRKNYSLLFARWDEETACLFPTYDGIADNVNNSNVLLGVPSRRWSGLYVKSINVDGNVFPNTTNTVSLGKSDQRWANIYSQKAVDTGSDIRLKDLQDSSYLNSLINVYDSITPIAYKWKNIKQTDTHDRIHIGLSSQEVEEKILENGLTRLDFGGLCVDPVYDDNGNQIDESYSLRYGEFHGLHILKNHQQDERITNLENQIANLKTQLELLKLSIGG